MASRLSWHDVAASFPVRVLTDSSMRGRAQWDPVAAAACVARLRTGCALVTKDTGDLLAQCGAIVGNVVDGAPCQANFECATAGARCEAPSGGGQTCGARVCRKPAATGQPCVGNGFCGPEDYCVQRLDGSGADMSTCESGAAGRPCDGGGGCDLGLFCNGGNDDRTAAGTCTAAKPAGSICAEDGECQGELLCVGEASTSTGFCRDVRAPGAQCDDLLGCFGHQYCSSPTAGMLGTCTPALAVGAPCGTFGGQSWCGATLACDGGTCQPAGPVGATCARSGDGVFSSRPDGCSTGLLCSNQVSGGATGVCEARHADGAACMNDEHCANGFCDATTRVCAPIPLCGF